MFHLSCAESKCGLESNGSWSDYVFEARHTQLLTQQFCGGKPDGSVGALRSRPSKLRSNKLLWKSPTSCRDAKSAIDDAVRVLLGHSCC